MKLHTAFRGFRRVYIDSAPLIYLVEQHPDYFAKMRHTIGILEASSIRVFTSVVTLSEILVVPLRLGNTDLAQRYFDVLVQYNQITLQVITPQVAISAAAIRARYRLRTPDALHAASALLQDCDAFLTNDSDFRRVADIEVLILDDLEL